jgi:hypothetical protein
MPEADWRAVGLLERTRKPLALRTVPVGKVKRLVVPETAVVKRGQMEVVMVVREGRAVLRLVTTGRVKGGRVEVLSGLEAGERVVATGVERVREGQPVKEGR